MASATIYEQGELDWCHEQTVRQVCTLSTEPIMCSECGERPAGPGNVYNRVTIEGPIEWDEKYYRICDVCQEAEEEWD